MSNAPEVFATDPAQTNAVVEHGAGKHVEPQLLGLAPYQIVSLAMLVLFAIAFFGLRVHRKMGAGLDGQIAAIRHQLDEAKQLRAEAEALRGEYAAKIAAAEGDAAALRIRAQDEAALLVEKARADSAAAIARRQRMAEDKISAAERAAVDEIRARVASAAAAASRQIIAERHDTDADRKLADQVIAGI